MSSNTQKFDTKHVPTGPTAEPQASTALDTLATQLQAEIQAIKNEQAAMLREPTTTNPMTPNGNALFVIVVIHLTLM
jgi:hypothetical protein